MWVVVTREQATGEILERSRPLAKETAEILRDGIFGFVKEVCRQSRTRWEWGPVEGGFRTCVAGGTWAVVTVEQEELTHGVAVKGPPAEAKRA